MLALHQFHQHAAQVRHYLVFQVKVHVEETSFNRPNPYLAMDGRLSTTLLPIDISSNYYLHIHPTAVFDIKLEPNWKNWDENELRKLDGVYGEAARIALFGSPDLIFKSDEKAYNMQPKIQIHKWPPIVQANATNEDKERK